MRIFLLGILTTLAIPALSSASEIQPCEIMAHWKASAFVYCPPTLNIEELAKKVRPIAQKYWDKRARQVHLYFFNDRSKTPKNGNELMNMSDDDADQHQTGIFHENSASGIKDFMCKKSLPKSKFDDCSDWVK